MSTYLRQTKALALAVFLALAVAFGLAFATPSAAQADEGDLQAGGIAAQAVPTAISYTDDDYMIVKDDLASSFGMLSPASNFNMSYDANTEEISVSYTPSNTTTYSAIYLNADPNDNTTWLDANKIELTEGADISFTLNKDYAGKAWPIACVKRSDGTATATQYYMAIPSLDKIQAGTVRAVKNTVLSIANDERMFKVVKATLKDYPDTEEDTLVFYLSGSSYTWAFAGGQDEAVSSFDNRTTNQKWVECGGKVDFPESVSYGTYDGQTATATFGYEFKLPVNANANPKTYKVVAFSGSSKLGDPGQNFSAREFAITTSKSASVLRASSASDTATVTTTSTVSDVPTGGTDSITYTGFTRPYAGGNQEAETYPLSNDWVGTLTINLGTSSVYDKAYAVTYEGKPWLKGNEKTKAPTDAEIAAIGDDGALKLNIVNEYDTTPQTTQLNGNIIKVMMHVKANAATPAADTWVERTFQLDFSNRKTATLKISGNPLTYNVTFVDEDGKTVLKAATPYAVGTKADKIVQPATPKKAPDSAYSYEFAGWTPALADVTADVTYKATYTKKAHPKVTFVDEDGTTVLKAATPYPVGTKAADIVQPATPTKAADRDYTYEFSGWTPALADVTADATYKATYKATKKGGQFNVTFVDENGTVLKAATPYATGTKAADIAQPAAPTKASDGTYTYEFAGWTPALADVTADATYTATYKATIIHHEEPARLEGNIALDTMKAIVDEGWKGQTGGTVVLTTVDGYWDALTAAGVAGMAKAPVLMSDGATLSDQTKATIAELAPANIVVCGGTAAVSDDVAQAAVAAAGGNAKLIRCWGQTATGTAVDCFNKAKSEGLGEWSAQAFVCTNDGYWDALAAAPISYAKAMPIFLTEGSSDISDETLTAMKDGGIKAVYIVGGEMAINPTVAAKIEAAGIEVAGRLAGEIAIATSEAVADFGLAHDMTCAKMGVATTNGYWDALAGAPLCGLNNSVLVLAGDSSSSSIAGFVTKHAAEISTCYVFGGKAAIDEATFAAIQAAIA